jgi:hypothetical protein
MMGPSGLLETCRGADRGTMIASLKLIWKTARWPDNPRLRFISFRWKPTDKILTFRLMKNSQAKSIVSF